MRKKKAFGGVKTEVASRRCHASRYPEAAASAPHWVSKRLCPNVIDLITLMTMYSNDGVGR
jgi:hypothetical protein